MTDQISDKLINECPDVDFDGLSLRALIRSQPESAEQELVRFERKPKKVKSLCSALWRGYVASYLLAAEGTLKLVQYAYPFCEKTETESFEETVGGDFWLVMKAGRKGETVFVPFRSGHVVSDETSWIKKAPRKLPPSELFGGSYAEDVR